MALVFSATEKQRIDEFNNHVMLMATFDEQNIYRVDLSNFVGLLDPNNDINIEFVFGEATLVERDTTLTACDEHKLTILAHEAGHLHSPEPMTRKEYVEHCVFTSIQSAQETHAKTVCKMCLPGALECSLIDSIELSADTRLIELAYARLSDDTTVLYSTIAMDVDVPTALPSPENVKCDEPTQEVESHNLPVRQTSSVRTKFAYILVFLTILWMWLVFIESVCTSEETQFCFKASHTIRLMGGSCSAVYDCAKVIFTSITMACIF